MLLDEWPNFATNGVSTRVDDDDYDDDSALIDELLAYKTKSMQKKCSPVPQHTVMQPRPSAAYGPDGSSSPSTPDSADGVGEHEMTMLVTPPPSSPTHRSGKKKKKSSSAAAHSHTQPKNKVYENNMIRTGLLRMRQACVHAIAPFISNQILRVLVNDRKHAFGHLTHHLTPIVPKDIDFYNIVHTMPPDNMEFWSTDCTTATEDLKRWLRANNATSGLLSSDNAVPEYTTANNNVTAEPAPLSPPPLSLSLSPEQPPRHNNRRNHKRKRPPHFRSVNVITNDSDAFRDFFASRTLASELDILSKISKRTGLLENILLDPKLIKNMVLDVNCPENKTPGIIKPSTKELMLYRLFTNQLVGAFKDRNPSGIIRANDKIVVFDRWSRTLYLHARAAACAFGPESFVFIDGSTDIDQRMNILHTFETNPKVRVLFTTLRTGAHSNNIPY
ncbi:hypothetical protein KDA14_05345, partial [Candidatus Saccharibacteria bacterium]|nr:hypothetical protein [Candidatus Saccharibacteria bacterium]